MKPGKSMPVFILLLSLSASGTAWARDGGGHGGGGHFGGGQMGGQHFDGGRHFGGASRFHGGHFGVHPGFGITIGPVWPFYYDPFYQNYYYPPPVVAVPYLPPGYWYYCYDPPGYYPYVQQCWSDWQQVVPGPP